MIQSRTLRIVAIVFDSYIETSHGRSNEKMTVLLPSGEYSASNAKTRDEQASISSRILSEKSATRMTWSTFS